MAKGERGAAAVVQNADALARQALTEVLKLAAQPEAALAARTAVPQVAPSVPQVLSPPPSLRLRAEPHRVLPLFSEISQKYNDMRTARDGKGHADIQILILRRQTFIDVVGDRPPDEYYPSDLQDYVTSPSVKTWRTAPRSKFWRRTRILSSSPWQKKPCAMARRPTSAP